MTLKEAYRVLRRYGDFLLGFDERNVADVFPSGEHRAAVRHILVSWGLGKPIINCAQCVHRGVGSACNLHVKGECSRFEEEHG